MAIQVALSSIAKGQLVAVLFGTNGRVVDGTYCGRIRRFLSELSPRFRKPPSAPPNALQVAPPGPLVQVPPKRTRHSRRARHSTPSAPTSCRSSNSCGWSAQCVDIARREARRLGGRGRQGTPGSRRRTGFCAAEPPAVELPPGADAIGRDADAIAAAARPWLSARCDGLLVSLGIPGGAAGVAAGAIVYFVMRRGKQRLQAEMKRLQPAGPAAASSSSDPAGDTASAAVVERHHNRTSPTK